MIGTSCLYEACGDLFAGYPPAVTTVRPSGCARSMLLMVRDGGDAGFFVLTDDHDEPEPSYSLSPWHASGGVGVGPDIGTAIPDVFVNVIAHGVPVPRHGSFWGWDDRGTITALIPVYAEYTPESPVPSWATMPLAGIPETQWPPFADEPLFGHWFWEHYRAGRIISLDGLIAATPGVVFWADTEAIIGSGCCAVAHDIKSPEGRTLQRGRYVYYQALRAAKPVPSLRALLADSGKIDLAARFRRSGHSEDGS
jgi:hypothetical protein